MVKKAAMHSRMDGKSQNFRTAANKRPFDHAAVEKQHPVG